MSAPIDRELAVFDVARHLAVEGRAAYLDEACAGDPALRRRVAELLRAAQEAGAFLRQPAPGAEWPADGLLSAKPPPNGVPSEKPGERIGRYKLLEPIGEGGCGVVYMAEQEEPVRRRVALKVVKLGMDTRQVIARFEAERQALALMDHPNIAKVLDAGATQTGRPFFVMELVRGVKITRFCDENNLSTQERLKLFVQICHAIQHAHQKGVIHRDIKPSNILVTKVDGEPAPKIIDFGIAKASGGQALTEKTLFTSFAQFIGTPAYMSPEQAELSVVDVDTRTDIYALGVLLYELLTGKTPIDQKELLSSGLDEMRRIIREVEPAPPSTRLSTLAEPEQTTVARQHQVQPPQLMHQVRGDLDWIVMKALEKDRRRRYETAESFRQDVLRFLNNEPIAARPPDRLYLLERLVRRNKLAFAAAGAVLAALVLGLGFSTWLLLRERAAERLQDQLRRRAEAEARKNEESTRFFKKMLAAVGPSVALGRDTTLLREILDNSAADLAKDLKHEPEIEAELRSTIGDVYFSLGDYTNSEAMHRLALNIRRSLWGNLNTNVAHSLDGVARARQFQASMRGFPLEDVEVLLEEALTIRINLLGSENPEVATSLWLLGRQRAMQSRLVEAEELLRRSLALRKQFLGPDHPDVAVALSDLVRVLVRRGKLDEAEKAARQALAIRRRQTAGSSAFDDDGTIINLGVTLRVQGKLDQAEAVLREALELERKALHGDHLLLCHILNQLAFVLFRQGKFAEAEKTAQDSLSISQAGVPGGSLEAFGWHNLGIALHKTGRLPEAKAALQKALWIWQQLATPSLPDETAARAELISVLRTENRLPEAEALCRDGIAAQRKLTSEAARQREANCLIDLADFLRDQRRPAEAETALAEALAAARKSGKPDLLALALLNYGRVLQQAGRLPDAEAAYREGLASCRQPQNFETYDELAAPLGSLLRQQGRLADAQDVLSENVDFGRKFGLSKGLARALAHLATLRREERKPAEAEPLYREGLDICRKICPEDSDLRQWLASGLGVALKDEGKLTDAELYLREAVTNAATTWPSNFAKWEWQLNHLRDVLVGQGKTGEVDKIYSQLSQIASVPAPSPTAILIAQADMYGRKRKWKEATQSYTRAIELQPTNGFSYFKLASVSAFTGQEEGYSRLCRQAHTYFGASTDPVLCNLALKTCLIMPCPAADFRVLSNWAHSSVTASMPEWRRPWAESTVGQAEYRMGHFAEAVSWEQKLASQADPIPERAVQTLCILALAQHQLQHTAEAGAALTKAAGIARTKLPQLDSGDLGDGWWDYLLAQMLLREAQGLIETSGVP